MTQGYDEGIEPADAMITSPQNNGKILPIPITVSGNTSLNTPIVLRLFRGPGQVDIGSGAITGNTWSATLGAQQPGTYRLEATQAAPTSVTLTIEVPVPVIGEPLNNGMIDMPVKVSGTNGTATHGSIILYTSPGNALLKGGIAVGSNGSWTTDITLPANVSGFVARQKIGTYESAASNAVTGLRLNPPTIEKPAQNEAVTSRPEIKGKGIPGSKVTVWQIGTNKRLVTDELVGADRVWSKISEVELLGTVNIQAKVMLNGLESPNSLERTFTVLGTPLITSPAPGSLQETTFTVEGSEGEVGATVHVLLDLAVPSVEVGRSTVLTGANWTASVKVAPGPVSLVAKQVKSQLESDRSTAVPFKVRAQKLTDIKWELLTTPVAGVKFSGVGHTGATVEITVVSGPGGTAPPAVQVRNGQWETTATNWPFGTYKLSAVQKVPDNANGWILSQPYTFDVVRAVPPPTNVKYTVDDRTPIFTGNGENGATVVITDTAGGSVDVPDAYVTTGTWSTRARAPWAPVNSRSIRVAQKIGTATSAFVEIKVTIESFAPPTEVAYSVTDYAPTFTGKGIVGATIHVLDAGNNDVTPPVLLTNPGWSTRALATWGPTKSRKIFVVHKKDGLTSTPVELDVTIGLQAPEITRVTVDELHAEVAGTCWAGAVVTLKFSDSADLHKPDVSNGTWVFKRPTPFTPAEEYTVTATQTLADLEPSPPASRQFAVKLPTPQIIGPDDKADVWRDFTVKGDKGYKGATMQLRDAQFGRDLGEPKVLTKDGEWSIDLTGLQFRRYTIDAQQKLNQGESERSESRVFEVVLVPPVISVPMENGDLPRTSTLSGCAMPGGRVEVWLKDAAVPLLTNTPVGNDGRWKAEVTLPIGAKTIRARQTFDKWTSKDSQPLNYNVVPAAPLIETPATGEHIGRRVVVSGFGVPGDSVTVRLGDATHSVLGLSPVLEDRTWSVAVEFNQPGGLYDVVAVASCDGFDSADSTARPVALGAYRPSVDVPAQGQWVSHPVGFKGQGRPGAGQVVSWFNPDRLWAPDLPVTGGTWQGEAQQSLPLGGQWCRFRQSITDGADGATVSDWVESKRFESLPPVAEP